MSCGCPYSGQSSSPYSYRTEQVLSVSKSLSLQSRVSKDVLTLDTVQRRRVGKCLGMVAEMVKSLPAMLETWVRSLGREDPLEKEMATHSNILAGKIP